MPPSPLPKRLEKILRGFIEKAEKMLDVKMEGKLPQIHVQDREPDFERPDLGMHSGETELVLPKCDEFLYKGLLAMEAFRRLLPASISGLPQGLDLAWAFAYTQFGKTERKKWKDIWRRVTKPVDVGDIVHYPVEAFTLLTEMNPKQGLAELISIFRELDRYHETIDTEEFVRLVEDFFTHYENKLSEREVRILEAVSSEPDIDYEVLSERLHIEQSKISATVTSLKRRGILFLADSPDFQRLGYSFHYLYLIPQKTSGAQVLTVLRHSPHLYGLGEFTDGHGGCLAHLIIPSWLEIEEELQGLKHLLEPYCQHDRCQVFRFVRGYSHRSFRHYSLKENEWRIPWQSWSLWLKRILTHRELASVLDVTSSTISGREEKPVVIDDLDWAILREVSQGESRARQLRKKLGIGSNLLRDRIQRLRKEGVIRPISGVLCVGLSEPVFLIIQGEPEELWPMLAAFDELPYHYSKEIDGDIRGLYSTLYLPQGEGTAFAHYLHKYMKEYHIHFHLGKSIPLSYWELPSRPK